MFAITFEAKVLTFATLKQNKMIAWHVYINSKKFTSYDERNGYKFQLTVTPPLYILDAPGVAKRAAEISPPAA